jgi:hypothetical protein
MHTNRTQSSGRRLRLAAAIAAVGWLLAVLPWFVAPTAAFSCGTTVFTGSVDPGSGTTNTTFVFTVTVTGGPTPTGVFTGSVASGTR